MPPLNVPRRSSSLPPLPSARWEIRPCDDSLADLIAREGGIPPLMARILTARGFSALDQIEAFLSPSLSHINNPFDLKDIDRAIERIGRAITEGEPIWIYGDYDVDGITATTILMQTLQKLGATVDYYIPHRLDEGYGLNREAIEQLAADGARLIITVDTGISGIEEAAYAAEIGVDLIITDHHEPGEELPKALAVINPKRPDCPYPFKGLAGVGVAFKLAHALLKQLHADEAEAREFLKNLMDLTALGTVADMVPLEGENRSLVVHGLKRLAETQRVGLHELCLRSGIKPSQISLSGISFGLAPRLNAAGRTEHAYFGAELLLTEDPRLARDLANKLESFNTNRRAIEQKILDEALELIEPHLDDRIMVVASEGWHPGVLGIVASRLQRMLYRPVLVIGIQEDYAKGSGRSIESYDLFAALSECHDHMIRFGGHKMAVGLTLEPDRIDAFREAINAYTNRILDEDAMKPVITIDTVMRPGEFCVQTVQQLARLEPHGSENPQPVVVLEGYSLIDDPLILKERHLKLQLAGPDGKPLTALGWNMAHRSVDLAEYKGGLRLAGHPMINTWNGYTSAELQLIDFQLV